MYMIIKSIPTTPKEVVISKYIFSILCFFIYVVSTLVVIALLRVLSINVPSISFSTLGISLSIFILLISLYVPVFFKALEKNFGYFNVSFIFILVLGYNFVFKKLEENYGMQNVVSSIANNMLLVSSLILVISLIVFYMSYKISISFYRNREEI
ncbi:ABC-2 transporter permease [Clostridium sp.]|uniref:ABC-2 transporter permease n=1 Tax=Clostridium sp. TaxID=1506 RepID=UPI003464B019